MKTINILFRMTVLLSLVLGALAVTPTPTALASTPVNDINSKGVSPEAHLNPDGTLKLDANFSGSFDIEGWDVQIDPAHGPVFSPVAAQDNWAALGSAGAFESVVNSVVVNGSDVFVGGWFQDLDSIPEADHIARWDGSQWNALSNNGTGNGALGGNGVDVIGFFNGNLYVGGSYLNIYGASGNQLAGNLAKWDGTTWYAVGGLTSLSGSNSVLEIAIYDDPALDDFLYVGGGFTNLNGIAEADYVASYNITTNTWASLDNNGAGDGSLTGSVYGLAVDSTNGEVYVGGIFADADGIANADRIAKWNGSVWSALGASAISSGYVFTILVNTSSEVYVGGSFTNVAGIATADYIAKWDGTNWSALGSYSGDGALSTFGLSNAAVRAMVLDSGFLYVAGTFNMSKPSLAAGKYLAKYNTGGGTWSVVDDNGSGGSSLIMSVENGGLFSLALSAGELYLGGYQTSINDNGTIIPNADFFSSMNTSTHNWSTYGIVNGVFQRNFVTSIAAIGTDVYVGGWFADANRDLRMDYLIRWDGSAWNPVGNLTQTNGSVNNRVYTLAVDGTNLYVGGIFTAVSNEGTSAVGTNRIAKWDTVAGTWSALGIGISNGFVNALAIDSNHNVYAGGGFTDVNSIPEADDVAKWDGANWSALAGNGSGDGALNGSVSAIALNGTNVYVGGSFTSVKDTLNTAIPNAAYLAQWDGSTWSAIPGTTTAFTGDIFALAYSGGNLFVGGNFDNANGIVNANRIAAWNSGTQTWSAMGDGSLNLTVNSIAVDGSNVYVGGSFTDVSNSGVPIPEADYVAKWNGSSWSALGSNGANNGALNSYVKTLAVIQNDLWAGGNFQNANNNGAVLKAADYLAAYGVNGTVPTVSSVTRVSASPTNLASVDFTVTFSESVTGVDAADFTLNTSGVSGALVGTVTGSGTTWTVPVNSGSGDGTIGLDVNSSGTGITDTGGNPLSGGFTGGDTYTIDKTAPTVTMSSAASNPTNSSPIAVTVQFSKTVTGFLAGDIIPGNGSVSNFTAIDGDTYTFDLTPSGQGPVTADIGAGVATDSVGNGNTAATQFSHTYNTTTPTVYNLFLPLILR